MENRILMTTIMGLGSTKKYKLQKRYFGIFWLTVKHIQPVDILKYKDLPLVAKMMIV